MFMPWHCSRSRRGSRGSSMPCSGCRDAAVQSPTFSPRSMPTLALNTAVSFASNTSWQSYAGETTLGYLSQMAGITVQSFLSAATGIAVAIALIRGFARRLSFATIGNFWVDMTRAVLYVLLPIGDVATLFLVLAGCPADPGRYNRASRRSKAASN